MIYIVEIQDKAGNTARKEYNGRAAREVARLVETELLAYPQWHVNDVWAKGGSARGLYGTIFVSEPGDTAARFPSS